MTLPLSLHAGDMVGGLPVRRAEERRREAAGPFYFRRLRQRRAPLAAVGKCRHPSAPQPERRSPPPREANRGDALEGLAVLESLVDAAFFADARLGSFLRSIASKDTANWDVASGKLGVFPCAPPVFSVPGSSAVKMRRLPRHARLRVVEQHSQV